MIQSPSIYLRSKSSSEFLVSITQLFSVLPTGQRISHSFYFLPQTWQLVTSKHSFLHFLEAPCRHTEHSKHDRHTGTLFGDNGLLPYSPPLLEKAEMTSLQRRDEAQQTLKTQHASGAARRFRYFQHFRRQNMNSFLSLRALLVVFELPQLRSKGCIIHRVSCGDGCACLTAGTILLETPDENLG